MEPSIDPKIKHWLLVFAVTGLWGFVSVSLSLKLTPSGGGFFAFPDWGILAVWLPLLYFPPSCIASYVICGKRIKNALFMVLTSPATWVICVCEFANISFALG
jgi:hypothetical protein